MCCTGLLRTMMFIFNGAIFLAGAAILGVGVWVKVDSESMLGIIDSVENAPSGLASLAYVSYLLIGVGAVLLIIGFLGCCGAVKKSKCMLLTFFSIVLIIFLIEVAGAVVLFVFDDVAEPLLEGLENEIRRDIQKNYGDNEGVTSLWNATMEQFKCCGYRNYTDFYGSPFVNDHGGNVYPTTCCNGTFAGEVCSMRNADISMVDGCFLKLVKLIEENTVLVAAVALGIAALEIAAMVVSMILYNSIGKE